MKKIMLVFGTRPEAIKVCPLIKELEKSRHFKTIVCVTGQHKEMLEQVLNVFNIKTDYNLAIMKNNQTLSSITSEVLKKVDQVLEQEQPDLVLVHGDTSTTYSAALASFYRQIPIGHIEAGLRTYNLRSPFPEEFNRQSVSMMAEYHFAPTKQTENNLLKENITKNIYVTGNTAIDALKYTVSKNYHSSLLEEIKNKKILLLTAHRRENIGKPMEQMFKAIRRISLERNDCVIVYPMHLNPKVQEIATKILGDLSNVKLVKPLDVLDFHNLLARSYLVLTDSGGIQEEAPALNIPVLVMRDETERQEGIEAGTLKLVGTDEENIYKECMILLDDLTSYQQMANSTNPYGDGTASQKICSILEENLL